jgi:hypothetical protein
VRSKSPGAELQAIALDDCKANASNFAMPGNSLCLFCRCKEDPDGLHGTLSEHANHAEGSEGSRYVACHISKNGPEGEKYCSRKNGDSEIPFQVLDGA